MDFCFGSRLSARVGPSFPKAAHQAIDGVFNCWLANNRHPDSRGSYPRLSEAEWRDLLFVAHMTRSLRFASLRSASVGMTEKQSVTQRGPVLRGGRRGKCRQGKGGESAATHGVLPKTWFS
jgi:hypothetical protein